MRLHHLWHGDRQSENARGDGEEGELITDNLKTISDIPKTIESENFPKDIDSLTVI